MTRTRIDWSQNDDVLWQVGDEPSLLLDLTGYGPWSHQESFEASLYCELIYLVFVRGYSRITVRDFKRAIWRVESRSAQAKRRAVAASQLNMRQENLVSHRQSLSEWSMRQTELVEEVRLDQGERAAEAIRLKSLGFSVGEVASTLCVSPRSVQRWIQQFRAKSA